MSNPWFRFYSGFIHDEIIETLSFEDQRHFIFVLCMKCAGTLDKKYPENVPLDRIVRRRLGLDGEAFEAAKDRLIQSGLVGEDWQPVKWNELQFVSDTSTERVRKYRERVKKRGASHKGNVSVTPQDTDTDTDTDTETETEKKDIDVFSDEFEEWWRDQYPTRKGSHSKVKAKTSYIRFRKSGVTKEQIWEATDRYFHELLGDKETKPRIGTEFVKHATTFLNDQPWIE